MTMEMCQLAKQMRVACQENPHCQLVSFNRDCANAFQHYVIDTLAFAIKRGGFMYNTVSNDGKVEVDFIYEPPQLQAVEYPAKSGLKEWVTAVVKLEVNEDMVADVNFEPFQMSDVCVKLFKEGWFETEIKAPVVKL
uniref:NPL4-like protein 1 n=1 Tax=Cajanus cajan TaxID=3821 RepID=A0A151QS55_CAJCA|nr:NPL4-like protein 1 [Cajanus cajan]KYP33083.1 NPL4-like protein 1 [Cajanus cajan]